MLSTSFSAGVDVRTVAGRLGHGGGGTTTLKVYAAWVSESDQRAATSLFDRLPARPDMAANFASRHDREALSYERVAAELRAQIAAGELSVGSALPTHKQLAEHYGISVATAHRVTALLSSEGLVEVSRGRRATVIRPSLVDVDQSLPAAGEVSVEGAGMSTDGHPQNDQSQEIASAAQLWMITVRGPDGRRYPPRHVYEDINRPDSFRAHLLAIARIEQPMDTDRGESWIGDYELEIRVPGKEHEDPKFTLRWQVK